MTFRLTPVADTVTHNADTWRTQNLANEPWVMVGSDGSGMVWTTYLRFDLSVIPVGWVPHSATLQMDRLVSPPLPTGAPLMQMNLHVTLDDWNEQDVTWDSPPGVGEEAVATCELVAESTVTDRCDLTGLISRSLERGHTRLGLMLAPSDLSLDFRRRWAGSATDRIVDSETEPETPATEDSGSSITLVLTSRSEE